MLLLGKPKKSIIGNRIRISSRISMNARPGWSEELWYELPAEFANYVTDRLDSFAVAMLPIAMHYDEDLRLSGTVSPKLLSGMQKAMHKYASWWPEDVHLIEIIPDEVGPADDIEQDNDSVAAAFSGGLDSFYTLQTHEQELSYIMFALGLDMRLSYRESYGKALRVYQKVAKRYGVQLIDVATNYREVSINKSLSWEIANGCALVGLGLSLGRLVNRFIVPSSYHLPYQFPNSTHPEIDSNFSTEATDIVHDDWRPSRTDKTLSIACDQRCHDSLRVCWKVPNGVQNCGQCEKCIRTMLTFRILGLSDVFLTFPPDVNIDVRSWPLRDEFDLPVADDVLELAREYGQHDLAKDIDYAIRRARRYNCLAEKIIKTFRLRGVPAKCARQAVIRLRNRT